MAQTKMLMMTYVKVAQMRDLFLEVADVRGRAFTRPEIEERAKQCQDMADFLTNAMNPQGTPVSFTPEKRRLP